MTTYFDYTEAVERDGKTYLYDSAAAARRIDNLAEIQGIHAEIFKMLERSDYPCTEEYCRQVAANGASGLQRCIIATTKELLPENCAKFWAKQQIEMAVSRIPSELMIEADNFAHDIAQLSDGVPIAPEDETFDDKFGVLINSASVKEKIDAGCSWYVTDADKELAQEIKQAILNLRKLRAKRVNIKMLCARWIGDPVEGFPEIRDFDLLHAATIELMPTDAALAARADKSFGTIRADDEKKKK